MLSIYSYLLTLSLCCFIAFSAAAQTGNCVVFSTDGTAFHLGIDNKFQNAEAHTNVKITSISEGDYWVTIMFYNQLHKAIKTSIRVIEDKEIAYHLIQDGSVWKLQQYSSVPKGQVKTLQTGQTVQAYNKSGVAVKGLKSADQIDPNNIARQETIRRVQGDHKDHEKRMGQFSGANGTTTPETSDEPTQALPTTGTTIINEYLEVENTDGTSKIIDQRTTIIKEIVERNGQKQLRTKKNKTQIDTDFNCLPIAKDTFLALKTAVKTATDKLVVAKKGIEGKCMTPNQIKAIGDLIQDEDSLNAYAKLAQKACASPNRFPYEIKEVEESTAETVATESQKIEAIIEQEKVIEEKIIEEHKTEAQLKAELKALKAKARLEKKIAKQKEKLAKKEAKRKAKEAKAASKK